VHPLLAAYLETLTAVNFVDANGYPRATTADAERDARLSELPAKYPPIDVPVVSTHPETGEKAIFVIASPPALTREEGASRFFGPANAEPPEGDVLALRCTTTGTAGACCIA
jgi:hypothetical protein